MQVPGFRSSEVPGCCLQVPVFRGSAVLQQVPRFRGSGVPRWRGADDARVRRLAVRLRRATRSPCPNIAEGFSRFKPRDFANFVRIAKASLSEFIDHMKEAEACGYTTPAETADLIVLAKRARGAATGLIQYLEHAKPPKGSGKRRRPRSVSENY